MTSENERIVRAFYDATIPGHREGVMALQAPDIVYEVDEGMPVGGGRFVGILDVMDRALANFYGAFDVRLLAEEFISEGEHVVAIGRLKGKTREGGVPIDVPFVHIWTVRGNRLHRLRFSTDTATLAKALARARGAGGADSGPR
jgi:ketosteroid isomerase-like protein